MEDRIFPSIGNGQQSPMTCLQTIGTQEVMHTTCIIVIYATAIDRLAASFSLDRNDSGLTFLGRRGGVCNILCPEYWDVS
jgi:hypothetical protein